MATVSIAKPSKWFSNKRLKLSLPLLHSKSSKNPSPLPSPRAPKNSENEDKFREVFHHFDGDGDGKISCNELREYFESIGETMSHEEAQGAIGEFDRDGDNLLEFHDFVRLMEGDNEVDDDLKRAFEMFEVDKGSGCITPNGLQRVLNRLGNAKSYEECVAMIQVFDLDGNGVLDFQEFHQMMT